MFRSLSLAVAFGISSFAPVNAQPGTFGPLANAPGCMGSNGVPNLAAPNIPGNVPTIGQTLVLEFSNLPTTPGGLYVLLGFSKVDWLGTPLPFDLGIFGIWGCTLYQSVDFVIPYFNPGFPTTFPLNIPSEASCVGVSFCLQFLVQDPGVMALRPDPHSVSNTGQGTIGV